MGECVCRCLLVSVCVDAEVESVFNGRTEQPAMLGSSLTTPCQHTSYGDARVWLGAHTGEAGTLIEHVSLLHFPHMNSEEE